MNFSLTEKIRELCEKNGISFFRLEKELHLGNGTIRAWDQNRPSIDKVDAVADYFGVSVDYLMGRNEPTDDEDINAMLADPEYRALFKKTAKMKKSDQEFVKRIIESIQVED